jgi:hypothetical protein
MLSILDFVQESFRAACSRKGGRLVYFPLDLSSLPKVDVANNESTRALNGCIMFGAAREEI